MQSIYHGANAVVRLKGVALLRAHQVNDTLYEKTAAKTRYHRETGSNKKTSYCTFLVRLKLVAKGTGARRSNKERSGLVMV